MKRMHILIRLSLFFFFLIVLGISSSAQEHDTYQLKAVNDEVHDAILQFYQYDKTIPLDLRTVDSIENESYIRGKFVFSGINNSQVVGYLAIPKQGQPPYPCVLQMHGMTVSKNDFWVEEYHHGELVTEGLLSAGYAVLALDMPYHGDRLYENNFESTLITLFRKGYGFRIRDMVVQSTIEYRRAIDYLSTLPDIDINRIGAIGYSLGSVVTFNLAGVDDRIKTIIVCSIVAINPRTFPIPEKYLSGIASQTFIPYLYNKPILILAAKNDSFCCTVQEAEQLYNLINGESKELIFYDSGHKLPPEHAPEATNWFKNNLK